MGIVRQVYPELCTKHGLHLTPYQKQPSPTDVPDGEIGVTRADDPEMQDMLELRPRLGVSVAIQGPAATFP